MNEFRMFSDAARLYAENTHLIDLMYDRMTSEIRGFLEALRNAVQERLDAEVKTKITKAEWWYCWLEIPGVPADATFQLCCKLNEAQIVLGRLALQAGAPQALPDVLERLAAVAHMPDVRDFCTPGSGGAWSLFTAAIEYGRDAPVTQAADKLEKLFVAARKAHGHE